MTSKNSTVADAIYKCLESPNEADRNYEPANVVDGLFAIARSLGRVADAIHRLGLADAATPMGAIESHGVIIKEAAELLAGAIAGRE